MPATQDFKHMEATLGEIKETLNDIQKRMQGLELREAGCSPLMNSKVDALFRRVDDHEARLKLVEELKQPMKITAWAASLAATAIILYIVNAILKIL